MARGLTAKDLEYIDELAAFFVESKENARLLQIMTALVTISDAEGAAAVFAKRIKEPRRQSKL